MSELPADVLEWSDQGRFVDHGGRRIFVVDTSSHPGPTVFILHGFPSSSFDWRRVVPELAKRVRVVTFDYLGFGLSDKPVEARYSLFEQADLAEAIAAETDIRRCVLVAHDLGDTVAAELLKRSTEGKLPFEIDAAVLTNGSIFIDLVQLSAGQQLLLSLPDEVLGEPLPLDNLGQGLRELFSREHQPPDSELEAMVALLRNNAQDRLLPRQIRYIEERRANQDRWTAGLVDYQGPLTALWGEQDPIAVPAMMDRLAELRSQTKIVRWADVGHWPPIEVPDRVTSAILEYV
ncbi:MAG: alpha/beta fold hydrolase [Actinomycetota bacterium]